MKIRIQETRLYSPQVFEQQRADELLIDTNAAPTTLAEVYNGVTIETDDGLQFGIAARDAGIEVHRANGKPGGVLVCSIAQSLEGLNPEPAKPYSFRRELAKTINIGNRERGSNTPDFILAEYMADCLRAFDRAVRNREDWYGRGAESFVVEEPEK